MAAAPLIDGTLLVAEGSALARIELSGELPTVLAQHDLGHGLILDLVQAGGLFYALTEEGLATLVASNDTVPQEVDFAPGGGQTFSVQPLPGDQGTLVAIAARQAGLRVLHVTSQGSIDSVATVWLAGTSLDVVLSPDGTRAYVAGMEAGVHMVDTGNPAAPHLINTLPHIPSAESVELVGALLAIGSHERILIADPTPGAERLVGTYEPLHDGRRIAAQGDFLFVADTDDGLKVFWVVTPDRLVQIYGETGRSAYDLWIEGDTLYLVGAQGLRILNIGNRYRPLQVSQLALPGLPQGIEVTPGRAFVALGEEGVGIVDVSNLSSPRLVRRIPLQGAAREVAFDGKTLYVATGESGLAVVDPAGPRNETLLGTFQLPGPALDIVRRDSTLFVAGGVAGLVAVDVSQSALPTLVGVLPLEDGHSVSCVTLNDRQAYLCEEESLIVADVGSPTQMNRLARLDVPAVHIAASGSRLYAVDGDHIAMLDAQAVANLVLVRVYTGLGHVSSLSAVGNRLLVSSAGDGPELQVLDLSAPDYPIETDATPSVGSSYRAWSSGSEVILALGTGGLRRYTLTEGGALIPAGIYATVPEAHRVSVQGNYLLVGGRGGWSLLELADNVLPHLSSQSFDGLAVRDLSLDGDTIAVAAGDQGVRLYTLAAGDEPHLFAQHSAYGPATGVVLDSRFVYVADAAGLSIYDRRYLLPVSHISTPAPAMGLNLSMGRAYLPLADGQVAIVDLADPTGGIRVRSTTSARRPNALITAPDGRTVYGLADDTLIRLLVSNPDRLAVLAAGKLTAVATHGFFVDALLWAVDPGDAIRLYDVSALASGAATQVGRIAAAGETFLVYGTTIYAAYGADGLGLIDLTASGASSTFYNEPVHALYREGSVLFALGTALTAWDVSHPTSPHLIASLPLATPGRHIAPMSGSGGLLLSLDGGLATVAWDGTALSLLGQLTTIDAVDQAVQVGQRAYLALHRGGLLVVGVSEPAHPQSLFLYTSASGQFVRDLLPLDGNNLLVSWEGGIDVLDVSAVTSAPHLLSVFDSGYSQALGLALAADGRRAALALGTEGVLLLELTDEGTLHLASLVDTPGEAQSVAFGGIAGSDQLYVADGTCGLRVIDLTDNANPQEQGYWLGSYASDVAVRPQNSHDLIYLAEANHLLTLRYEPDLPAVFPPQPQFPDPANLRDGVSLTPLLTWGPPPDRCNPLSYRVYLGVVDDPPLLGEGISEPALQMSELDPLRTYHWQVEAADAQGDTIRGPLWTFTTASADFADTIPPAPPILVERLRQSPVVPAGLVGAALVAAVVSWLYWRSLRRRASNGADSQDWFSTHDEK